MEKIKHLSGFEYFQVGQEFPLLLETSKRYFRDEVLNKEMQMTWNNQKIDFSYSDSQYSFDSGVICAKTQDLISNNGTISELKCFVAPYRLMRETIVNRHAVPKTDGELAIAIGMVLSIIATKGSSEKSSNVPYLLFVKRSDTVGVRKGELDVAVVEGINASDFSVDNSKKAYCANLETIARRALEEERGLNYDILTNQGLLHMPKGYYLGYDEEYHQWNFFGTVTVDCTVEEIIRQGYYFTKDRFETREIFSIPLEPQSLFYYLSREHMWGYCEKKPLRMWKTAWASVFFSIQDYYPGGNKKEVEKGLKQNKQKKRSKWWRKKFDNLSMKTAPLKQIIEVVCLVASILALLTEFLCKILLECENILKAILKIPFIDQTSIDKFKSGVDISFAIVIPLFIAMISLFELASANRYNIISHDHMLHLFTGQSPASERYAFIPRTNVFRNVCLLDGCIAKKRKEVRISSIDKDGLGRIEVQRQCNVFSTFESGDPWVLCDMNRIHNEDSHWVISACKTSPQKLRFVIPCIQNERDAILHMSNAGKLSHLLDFTIEYKEFLSKDESEIKKIIWNKILSSTEVNTIFSPADTKIDLQFLLESKGESIIVCFLKGNLNVQVTTSDIKIVPLLYDYSDTTFSNCFKDDVTRVAFEYAIAQFLGYRFSDA